MSGQLTDFRIRLAEWASKFDPPLTERQAAQVMLDDRKFDKELGEFTQPRLRDLYGFLDYEELCHSILKEARQNARAFRFGFPAGLGAPEWHLLADCLNKQEVIE